MSLRTAFLTYDLELAETSLSTQLFSADRVEREIATPLARHLEWAQEAGFEATVFVEIGQFAAIRERWPALMERILSLLGTARARGLIDVQLHVHPNWDPDNGAVTSDQSVRFGGHSYEYARGRESSAVETWISRFESLFGVKPTAFRAGKYRVISDALRAALIDSGIRVFSSSIQGSTIVADNGDVLDFREVSEARPVIADTRGMRTAYDVPVTSRGGRVLSPDYAPPELFAAFVGYMAQRDVPLCLVSHQKDMQGEFFEQHVQNISAARNAGYRFVRLREEYASKIAAQYQPALPDFSAASLQLLQLIGQRGRLSRASRTPFPEWVLEEILRWQQTAEGLAGSTELQSVTVRRGIVPRRVRIRGRAPHLVLVVAPGGLDLVRGLKYIARRIVFMAPARVRRLVRRLQTDATRGAPPNLDLFRFFSTGATR